MQGFPTQGDGSGDSSEPSPRQQLQLQREQSGRPWGGTRPTQPSRPLPAPAFDGAALVAVGGGAEAGPPSQPAPSPAAPCSSLGASAQSPTAPRPRHQQDHHQQRQQEQEQEQPRRERLRERRQTHPPLRPPGALPPPPQAGGFGDLLQAVGPPMFGLPLFRSGSASPAPHPAVDPGDQERLWRLQHPPHQPHHHRAAGEADGAGAAVHSPAVRARNPRPSLPQPPTLLIHARRFTWGTRRGSRVTLPIGQRRMTKA